MQSRRLFLKSGAMAMLSVGFAPSFLARTAAAAPSRKRLLITIFQRGAMDGLNVVVPFKEAAYYQLRPSLAIPQPGASDASALDLNGTFGLHPRLAPLKPFWDSGTLAIVHACGSPDPTRSHFDAQDYMETATPGVKSTRDGWLNRYLQASGDALPLRGMALTRQMPRSLQGRAPALAFAGLDSFIMSDARARQTLEATYAQAKDTRLASSARDAFDAMRVLRDASSASYVPAGAATYPRSPFGQALQEIARLAKADVGLEVAFAESTGWDHHVNEAGQLAARLDDLAGGIAALVTDLGDRMADTVILTMSEFGRTVAENGSGGTDHGRGNVMFALGGAVKGGEIYGPWPGLADHQRFEGRDLAISTDFRDVFGEIVTAHLGATSESLRGIFPGYTSTRRLNLVRA